MNSDSQLSFDGEKLSNNDRRFQIFISSTFEDLKNQRKEAIEVIFERGHIPIALERFSAANESDLEVIKSAISTCQVYILILGHRYGEIVPGRDISFTELEFEIAEKNGLLILPFIMKKEEITRRRKSLDPSNAKDEAELKNYERLTTFHKRIQRFCKLWGTEDQFKYLVATALSDNLDKCNKPAFVLEPEEATTALIASASQNEFIVDVVEELKNFEKLYRRCSQQRDEKKQLARYFREQYLDRIINNKVSLFFESGSTVAYLTRELAQTLSRVVKIKEKGKPNIQISTNNVLSYLQLWLTARIPCTTFPWSPPTEDTYGALYGGLEKIESKGPDYVNRLDDDARKEISRFMETPFTLTAMPRPALLLSATSGLQISEAHKLKFQDGLDEPTINELKEQLSKCFGPHIGSYRNKVFKRFLYETKLPIMLFITGNKIDCEIEVGKCHFVLDNEFSWQQFYKEHPVAFCVGTSSDMKLKYMNIFRELGFEILTGHSFSPTTSFIARNPLFIEQFEKITPL